MRVAVVTVGDELLAGDTVNTNAAWLGRELNERGARVERIIVVPDRVGEIAEVVNECRAKYDVVIVTGGLGPTHDDVTIDGVAAALGRGVEQNVEAVEWFDENSAYSYDELVDGTADLPREARMLPNTVGVAPGAVVEGGDGVPVYVLPGVPEEMKAMFDLVADEFTGTVRERRFLATSEPESALLDRIAEVRERFDVTVGSYPGQGSVRIRLESEDPDAVEAAAAWLEARLES